VYQEVVGVRFVTNNAVRLVIVLTAVVYLGTQLAMFLAFTDMPTAGWIGFALVAIVVTGLAVAAIIVFERTSEYRGPDWGSAAPAVTTAGGDGRRRVLVVADTSCSTSRLCARVMDREVAEGADVLVVAPLLVSPLRYAASDEDAAWRNAEERVRETAELLRRMGARARGEVGTDDPLEAIHDALALFHADEVVIVTLPDDRLTWLEGGLVERARETTGLPIRHVVVEADVPIA
jgi:hypothetical protein